MMTDDDTYVVRLPRDFPLARLAAMANEHGYFLTWKQPKGLRSRGSHEVVSLDSYRQPDRGEPTQTRLEGDRGEPV